MTIDGNPLAEDELHSVIAHWIAADCLTFSIVKDALFRILAKASTTNHKNEPHTRYQAVDLLDAKFAAYQKGTIECFLPMLRPMV